MEAAEDVACDQDAGTHDLEESIVAIDVRDKKMMGCSIFSTADGVLKIANDIPMVNENVAEQFLNFAQATTILMSRRVPETILAFVEKHVERNAKARLVSHLMSSSDFSHMFACEELSSLYPHGVSSFPIASPSNIERQSSENNIQAPQTPDRQEPHCMKLIRCGSLIDLDSVASLSCAGAIFTELHRRRSLASSLSSSITENRFNVVSITMFNLVDHVFISEESLLSLQIINHESHPNSQAWSVDSSAGKENLSIYGLLHPLASTPQGRTHLRHMFLNPTSNLDIIADRQCTVSMLLEPNNEEKTRRAVSIGTLRRFASQSLKLREVAIALSGPNQGSIIRKIIDGIPPLAFNQVGSMIDRVVNFDETKFQQRYSVKPGIDVELDALKRQYDGMNSLLTEVANSVTQDLPTWARRHIKSCIFLPQLGFLTVVEQDSQQTNGGFDLECTNDGQWKKSFVDNEKAYYKNRHMTDLDNQYGDIYSQISEDREVEVMQKLAVDIIAQENTLLAAATICGEFDALLALAIGATKYGWNAPQMTTENIIDIKGGRHPLQELLAPSFIPNDCFISDDNTAPGRRVQALVLTGPNQSGKSVYIKQVAAIVYLAHIGSYVPADKAVIGTVDKILTRISSRESVSSTGSTFALDLKQVSHAMKYATSRSLIILDEFGNGTTADDGSPKVLAATHFYEIFANGYLNHHSQLALAHMELVEGYSSTSLGSQCARISGIPEIITDRAELLSAGESPASPRIRYSPCTPYFDDIALQLPSFSSSRISVARVMAIGALSNSTYHAIDEEARAEVDVLNSRLDRTTQLTKKIQASLGRLEATGQSVRDVAGPLNGETRRLQTLSKNVESVLAAIDRLRQPSDSKDDEEQIIRSGPEKAGLSNYLASIKRLSISYKEMQTSNLRANQGTMNDLTRLIKLGNTQLENHFDKILRGETPRSLEPLHYITKDKPFPVLSQDKIARLGLIYSHVAGNYANGFESSVAKIYADIRGPYLSASLANLAAASVNTAKKKNPGDIYQAGANGIGTYTQAMEGIFIAEYDNICSIFTREDWGPILQATCQAAVTELARTLRELNTHIKSHLTTDCYMAYEVTEIISGLSNNLDKRTGELKGSLSAALKPVRETAKSSLAELLEETKRKIGNLQTLPTDGAASPIVAETMQRLNSMVEFLRPISSIMISLGDGGWKPGAAANGRTTEGIPSLASFDVGADGKDLFAKYCLDTIEVLLSSLDQKARVLLRSKSLLGVFLANSVVVIDHTIRSSELGPLLDGRLDSLDQWRKKATVMYTDICRDISVYLFDTIHTNRTKRPTSGHADTADSASVVKGLNSKDKDKIKEKFTQFNNAFDDMVGKHKSYSMDREVRAMFGQDIRQKLQPLYERFWDRYHEIDKGKGKYVKYDKQSIAGVFMSLAT
ncbi:exo70 exocyst complex subunit domain-containing protein [Trichoderma breve]|uniref:Exo70 exocyst complex subunit domain-containing protein n=1 Tax=Trichoderma breve TaxID=2034170 RepID=A0A9W9JRD9_9HYPO|nr:exo70 exocyst complex subunit domain-containing protein [Trichoderma breve]KAJ4864495.1 exo70 exocyst complex subunit domain-containing protein [Trichoderma breve]